MRLVTFFAATAIGVMTCGGLGNAEEPTKENFKKTGSADYDETVQRYIDKATPKIVGGKPATPGAYPWQASLVVSNIPDAGQAHFCGGSIVNEKWIVTAAHCMTGLTPSHFQVIVGTYSLNTGAKRYAVKRRIVHGDYEKVAPSDSDVALVELEQPLEFGVSAKPTKILEPADEPTVLAEGAPLIVTGWGATKEGGNVIRDLREVTVPFLVNNVCSDPLSYGKQITDNMICAGLTAGGKDSCQGDSGGPLVSTAAPIRQVGVVSWGEGCARPGKPGVYTRISNFKSWIETCVAGGQCLEKK
jgi:secreted trypsin-like serine protease